MNGIHDPQNHREIDNQSFLYLHPLFLYMATPRDAKISLNHYIIHVYHQRFS